MAEDDEKEFKRLLASLERNLQDCPTPIAQAGSRILGERSPYSHDCFSFTKNLAEISIRLFYAMLHAGASQKDKISAQRSLVVGSLVKARITGGECGRVYGKLKLSRFLSERNPKLSSLTVPLIIGGSPGKRFGRPPTLDVTALSLHERLQGGSLTTIYKHLNAWKQRRNGIALATMQIPPDSVRSAFSSAAITEVLTHG